MNRFSSLGIHNPEAPERTYTAVWHGCLGIDHSVQEAASTKHAVTGTPNRREPMKSNYFPFFLPQS